MRLWGLLKSLKSSRSRERLARSFQVCMGNSRSVWVSPGMSWPVPLCAHSLVLSRENPGSTYVIFWSILVSFCPFKRTIKRTGLPGWWTVSESVSICGVCRPCETRSQCPPKHRACWPCRYERKRKRNMEKQMKRTVYEAPLTDCFQIELEGAFMAGSQTEIKTEQSSIEVEEYDSFENEVTFD